MALFTPTSFEGDLIALEPTEVCLVPRQAIQDILQAHPEVALRIIQSLAARLTDAERLIADLGARDVGQRLAAELLRLADTGEQTAEGMRVRIATPWHQVAQRLGTTPESLSRRLGTLADDGIIRQEGGRVVLIRSLDRMRQIAHA